MRYKRARTKVEVQRDVAGAMGEAPPSDHEADWARRIEKLQMERLLMDQWDLDEVEADLQWCGVTGSPTKVHRVQSIVLTKEGYTEVEPTEDGVRGMIHELIVDHTLG
jgi:electron transfer flavoprotein beta subunit